MLPDWMIEEIERDRRAREEGARPRLELEVPNDERRTPDAQEEGETERGVVTIEIL
jgi:hypothetical protein